MGRAGTPEILRAVTHSGLLCPHLSNNEARLRSSKRRMSAPPPEKPGEMLGEHLSASVLQLRWGLQEWVLSVSAKEEHPKEKETEFNILYPPKKRALIKVIIGNICISSIYFHLFYNDALFRITNV